MGKNPSNDNFLKDDKKEDVDVNHEVFDEEINWMCMTECHCSDDGNPMRAKRWIVGSSIFSKRRPSKHFVTLKEYDASRAEILASISRNGGLVTDAHRTQPLHVLKALDVEQKRTALTRRAQIS